MGVVHAKEEGGCNMTRWIEAVLLCYDLTDSSMALYLRQFFKLIGVYVYEWRGKGNYETYISNSDYFTDIVILSNQYIQHHKLYFADYSEKTIFVIPDKKNYEALERMDALQSKNVICCDFQNGRDKLLLDIIDKIQNIYVCENKVTHPFFDEWKILSGIYVQENMFDHMYICEYFALDNKLFIAFSQAYKNVINKILEAWKAFPENSIYFQYAFLYLAYSVDEYCRRNNDTYIYNIHNINDIVTELCALASHNHNVLLLKARIKNDLLHDHKKAKEIYEELSQSVNWGEIYFRLGLIKEKNEQNYLDAMLNYQMAMRYLSEKSDIISQIAECWDTVGDHLKAASAWSEVRDLLLNKCESNSLSLVECNHLYKASMELGDIWIKEQKNREAILNAYASATVAYNIAIASNTTFPESIMSVYSITDLRNTIELAMDRAELLKRLADIRRK